ncbi:MAG: CHRD domain-containing protein [Pirellulales bacterium]
MRPKKLGQLPRWDSLARPAGAESNPYLPVAATGDLQIFSEAALWDAAVRYQAPKVPSRLLIIAISCLLVGKPLPAATINMSAFLDASGVVDPRGPGRQDDLPIITASSAKGVCVFELDTTTNVLSYEILFTDQLLAGLEIGADLRAPDSAADVLFPLPLGHYKGGVTRALAPPEVASLAVGAWSVSIRTAAYPAGEIGGYIGTAPEPASGSLALTALVLLAVFSAQACLAKFVPV